MILHHFCWRSSKITLFCPKTIIFDEKSRKYQKDSKKKQGFLGFPRDPCGGPLCIIPLAPWPHMGTGHHLNTEDEQQFEHCACHSCPNYQQQKTSLLSKGKHWAQPGPGWGPVRVGARSGLEPIWAHISPYGPIWALMGPIRALMGP